MEDMQEQALNRLHAASSDDADGDRADGGSDSGLSSADDWATNQDAEAELPFISPANVRVPIDDILSYVCRQFKREQLEASGKSNRSISASIGHLVRRLSGSSHQVVFQTVESLVPEPTRECLGKKYPGAEGILGEFQAVDTATGQAIGDDVGTFKTGGGCQVALVGP